MRCTMQGSGFLNLLKAEEVVSSSEVKYNYADFIQMRDLIVVFCFLDLSEFAGEVSQSLTTYW